MVWLYIIAGILLIIFLVGSLQSCVVVKTDYSSATIKDATVYYYLPESIIKIKSVVKVAVAYNPSDSTIIKNGSSVIEQTYDVSSEIVADTKDLLSLNYKPNALMSDEIKYAVNAKGLLETVNITTEDKLPEIIKRIAEAPAGIFKAEFDGIKGPLIKIKEYSREFIVKAATINENESYVQWNLIVENELTQNGFDIVNASFTIASPDIKVNNQTLAEIINTEKNSNETEMNGILTRPLKNVRLALKSAEIKGEANLPVNVVIADETKLIVIPVQRTAFVKRVNKISIKDGVILSNEITKPSSVEGFIGIPIGIAKSIVSIPAQLIQFRFDNTTRLNKLEAAKLTYEKSLEASEKYAQEKQKEIDKVRQELDKATASNKLELQEANLALQKSLSQAQLQLAEVRKSIEDLKAEIVVLKKGK